MHCRPTFRHSHALPDGPVVEQVERRVQLQHRSTSLRTCLRDGRLNVELIQGCYLALDNILTIESVVTALKERPHIEKLLVAGDFNANMSETKGERRGKDIAAALAPEGLEDMLAHFLPLRSSW